MLKRCLSLACVVALTACGGQDSEPTTPAAATPSPPPAAAAPPAAAPAAGLPRTPSPAGATVYIISPENGAVVSSPVRVVFGLKGFGVVPVGIPRPDAGHHHLLVDTQLPPLNLPIPADANHVHFGKGQTEAEITLAPGRHELRLLVGDHLHVPHDPPIVSETIAIEVR